MSFSTQRKEKNLEKTLLLNGKLHWDFQVTVKLVKYNTK